MALEQFVGFAKDISSGVNACLQIIYASDLAREQHADAEPEESLAPAIGKADAARLFRFSMAAAALLPHMTDERIDAMNAVA